MSRIGKQPIIIPDKVEVKINDRLVTIKGPKGELLLELAKKVKVELKEKELLVSINDENDKEQRSLWGTTRSLLQNMVTGLTEGFEKKLEINGVGFKAAMQGKNLILNVGFSHPVEYKPVDGITISVEKNVITINGYDKEGVGQAAAQIRAIKKPEPYKGKGIKYSNEVIKRKAGKVAKGGEK